MTSGRLRALAGLVTVSILVLLSACSSQPESVQPDAGGSPEAAPFDSAYPVSLARYYTQEIDWRPCDGGFQCGSLTVPLDYERPNWRQIEIAVTRRPAGNPDKRIGALVVNPGGPGGSGISYAHTVASSVAPKIRQRFDIVGFDPRGVGKSTDVQCLSDAELFDYLAQDATPDDPGERAKLVSLSKQFARGCRQRSGKLLPYVGTINAARDMDILRAVLGDEKLTYLGKSYGTQLGAYYAELFPKNVRALVLDGAVNLTMPVVKLNRTQAKGFERALRSFVRDCVQRTRCPLGNTDVKAAINRLERFFARIDDDPLPTDGSRKLSQASAKMGLASALYNKQIWPFLRKALRQALHGDGTALLRLADAMEGRQPDGSYTNLMEANMAINCVDMPAPEKVARYAREARQANKVAPHFGASVMWGTLPCAFWPVEPDKQITIDGSGAPPILVVGTTRDPATPYAWAKALARQLDSGVLLTYKGDGHTAYLRGSECVDRVVNTYLIHTKPPEPGTVCE